MWLSCSVSCCPRFFLMLPELGLEPAAPALSDDVMEAAGQKEPPQSKNHVKKFWGVSFSRAQHLFFQCTLPSADPEDQANQRNGQKGDRAESSRVAERPGVQLRIMITALFK